MKIKLIGAIHDSNFLESRHKWSIADENAIFIPAQSYMLDKNLP